MLAMEVGGFDRMCKTKLMLAALLALAEFAAPAKAQG
jgi:hypothetical protein